MADDGGHVRRRRSPGSAGVKDTRAHRDRWIADWLDSIGYAEREANARQHPSGGGYDCDAPIYWATGTNEPAPAPAPVAFPPVVSSAASNRVSDGALAVRTPVTDDDVRGALAELGAPLAVADEASTGRVSVGPTGPQPGVMSRAWVPMVVAVAQATGLAIALPCGSGSSAMVTTNPVLAGSPLALFVMVLVVTLPLWATVAVLVGVSPLWPGREKAAAMLLIPGAAVLLNLLPLVGYALGGVNGVFAGAWAAMAVVLLGGARELMYCRRRWGR